MITGQTLRNLRRTAGLTAQAVASRAGITPQQLSKIESGHRTIEVNEYVAIMKAMGYQPGDHLPNALGDDVATYLPILQQLRQLPPEAMVHVQEMLRAAAALMQTAPPAAQKPESAPAQAIRQREAKTDMKGLPL